MENTVETKASLIQKTVNMIKGMIPEITGIIIGGVGGFIFYKFFGCTSGTCPVVSNVWLTILLGAATGYLTGNSFNNKNIK